MKAIRILLCSKDEHLCKEIKEAFYPLDVKTEILTQCQYIADEIHNNFYNLILFEVSSSDDMKFDLVTNMLVLPSISKVILIADSGSKEKALRVLHAGAYDLLEKPVSMALLTHKVAKALEVQKLEIETHELRSQLRTLKRECMELSKALSFIARNAEERQQEEKQRLVSQMRNHLLPILKDISKDKDMEIYEAQFSLLLRYLDNLCSDIPADFQALEPLSSRELRVIAMIKQGLTSEDIADHLRISPQTVKTHRRNIRKKLGITGTKNRLHTMPPPHHKLSILHR